eukprot:164077_1
MDLLSGCILTAIILACLLFCVLIVQRYSDPNSSSFLTCSVSVGALFVALGCVLLLPVDIYLASSQTQDSAELRKMNIVRYLYYVFYSAQLLFTFVLIPWAYFYFEEDDLETPSPTARACSALRYTMIFVAVISIIMITSVFVKSSQDDPTTDIFAGLKNSLSRGDIVLLFSICCMTVLGMIGFVTYTAIGLAHLPIAIMRSLPTPPKELPPDLAYDIERHVQTIEFLQISSQNKDLTPKERSELREAHRERDRLRRLEEEVVVTVSWSTRIWNSSQPIRLVVGAALFTLSLFIAVSFCLAAADRILNSPCGVKCGWTLDKAGLPNPMDLLFAKASEVFPLDYIAFGGIILYLFLCTLSSLDSLGVRLFCLRLYSVKPRRTMQNGLLMGIWLTTLVVLTLNLNMMTVVPQYAAFGTQKYTPAGAASPIQCELSAKPESNCVLSEAFHLIGATIATFPIFGILFTSVNVVFAAVFVLSSTVKLLCPPSEDDAYAALDDAEIEPEFRI